MRARIAVTWTRETEYTLTILRIVNRIHKIDAGSNANRKREPDPNTSIDLRIFRTTKADRIPRLRKTGPRNDHDPDETNINVPGSNRSTNGDSDTRGKYKPNS